MDGWGSLLRLSVRRSSVIGFSAVLAASAAVSGVGEAGAAPSCEVDGGNRACTFAPGYSGTYTLPGGVSAVTLTVVGGNGGNNFSGEGAGMGTVVSGTLSLTGSCEMTIVAGTNGADASYEMRGEGGKGGLGPGGDGGEGSGYDRNGGGGGGASTVTVGSTVVIAGGGGGSGVLSHASGGSNGGDGGGLGGGKSGGHGGAGGQAQHDSPGAADGHGSVGAAGGDGAAGDFGGGGGGGGAHGGGGGASVEDLGGSVDGGGGAGSSQFPSGFTATASKGQPRVTLTFADQSSNGSTCGSAGNGSVGFGSSDSGLVNFGS
ncbi:hypothetical protein [Gordonia hydrophobica]|uniref:Glycine rich protein n=1 Tax=Gordonia hydrophobica TaxID=40516 RepID=A0ABZ2TW74_9ACTN|nr:hypothetical protein [Gordonia hydrophobica]MBM7365869.1 hypothetical protein [Gordonia hydrophobica]